MAKNFSSRRTMLSADVAIIGGGFGGCLLALVTKAMGLDPVVVEKNTHPRFTIGESTTPIANMVLRDLADRYDLAWLRPLSEYGPWQETYPDVIGGRKRGFSYFFHQPHRPFRVGPDHPSELLVTANHSDYRADTHWLRADVDAFLARRTRNNDIPFLEATTLTGVKRDGPNWRIRGRRRNETTVITARFLVGATGADPVLRKTLDITDHTSLLRAHSTALYGHFEGVQRWKDLLANLGGSVEDHPFSCDEAALHHVLEHSWMWVLRFADERVSAGLVRLHPDRNAANRPQSPERQWQTVIERYPALQRQFNNASLASPPGRIIETGRLQYLSSEMTGPNWALLPGAAGFSGPLHSTGIAHTLTATERLAHLLEQHWHQSDRLEETLRNYETALKSELLFIDRLIALGHHAIRSPTLWRHAMLYYFAAATTYERRRVSGTLDPRATHPAGSFLLAGDRDLRVAVEEALSLLSQAPEGKESSDGAKRLKQKFIQQTKRALGPYDAVGLFDPPVPNMYPYTAPPRSEEESP